MFNDIVAALERCDGKCLDNESERAEVAEVVERAIKAWFVDQ
jgi:hypothetical protein